MNNNKRTPHWIPCPVCKEKTDVKIYEDTLVLYGAADYYGQYSGTYFENWSVDDQDLVWINAIDGSIIGAS